MMDNAWQSRGRDLIDSRWLDKDPDRLGDDQKTTLELCIERAACSDL